MSCYLLVKEPMKYLVPRVVGDPLDLVKSIKLEGNCSNPTAINVCKRRLMTCCHLCTCSRFGLSSSPNHRLSCLITYQSPYRKFYHTYRYPLAGILHNSRYYLRAHFGQIEIFPVYTIFIPCHRKYSQSEYRKAVVYSTVFNPTFPSCSAVLFSTKFSQRIFYGMV